MKAVIESKWYKTMNSYGSEEQAMFIGYVKVAGYVAHSDNTFTCRGYPIRKASRRFYAEKDARALCEDICREYMEKLTWK
jgi:hypothetical protein